MFLVEIKGGLSNYHQTKCWNESVVEMMLVQTLKSHRNLKRSSFSIFIQKYFAKLFNAINPTSRYLSNESEPQGGGVFMPILFRLTNLSRRSESTLEMRLDRNPFGTLIINDYIQPIKIIFYIIECDSLA